MRRGPKNRYKEEPFKELVFLQPVLSEDLKHLTQLCRSPLPYPPGPSVSTEEHQEDIRRETTSRGFWLIPEQLNISIQDAFPVLHLEAPCAQER